MAKERRLSIIVKPTHDCNLRCKYCYVEEEAEKGRMSEETLKKSLESVANFAENSHWIWHGGEPLIMGIDFYKHIKEIQQFYTKKKDVRFNNGIQTNGTLVTDEILDFVEEFKDFHLGMSLDGPEYLHNQTRIFKNGQGSFDRVMKGINLVKERNKGKTEDKRRGEKLGGGVICVINSHNIQHPKELYEFFRDKRINVKFNPLIKSGRAEDNFKDLGITSREYGRFLTKLWDIYNNDVAKSGELLVDIDPFMDVLGNIATEKPIGCNYSHSCRDTFISIGPQGDVYPCGRFDGIPEFKMGNVHTHTIREAVNAPINQKLKTRGLETVAGCGDCKDNKLCNSGCMHNAYCSGDVMGKDPYCSSYKTLFKKMTEVLEKEEALQDVCSK